MPNHPNFAGTNAPWVPGAIHQLGNTSATGTTFTMPTFGQFSTVGSGQIMTSTSTNVSYDPFLHSDMISLAADGCLVVQAGGWKIKVPAEKLRDIITLAEMALMSKMAPEEADAQR